MVVEVIIDLHQSVVRVAVIGNGAQVRIVPEALRSKLILGAGRADECAGGHGVCEQSGIAACDIDAELTQRRDAAVSSDDVGKSVGYARLRSATSRERRGRDSAH